MEWVQLLLPRKPTFLIIIAAILATIRRTYMSVNRTRPNVITYDNDTRVDVSIVLDGQLQMLRYVEGLLWAWDLPIRAPSRVGPVDIVSNPTAVVFNPDPFLGIGYGTPWFFAAGADGNLWARGGRRLTSISPEWHNLQSPLQSGNRRKVRFASNPTAIVYSGDQENVFVLGADGNLWVDHYEGGWGWAYLGNPGQAFDSNPTASN
jgi:hypothetical protein